MRDYNASSIVPLSPVVKALIIVNVCLWLGLVEIVQQFFMSQPFIFQWFGLVPINLISGLWIWQPFTYMFVHSQNVFHVVFNMLLLWLLGSDLEYRLGSRMFLIYYMFCGVGAAIVYVIGLLIYYGFTADLVPMNQPVVGASGAVLGLMVAYGMLFGERIVYFMMAFPMKAKYFVLILGAVEVVSLLDTGVKGSVANLAHIGGLISGYLFFKFLDFWRNRQARKGSGHGRRLKLVVDNKSESDGPRFWN